MNLKEVLKTLIARFHERKIDFVLSGGLALSTMNIFRFTKDIDFVVHEEAKDAVHDVMKELGYDQQDFSSDEIISYLSPLKVFGQVDFLLARRKYTKAMMQRAQQKMVFDGEFEIKSLMPEDIIGLKVQAISNDPENRYPVDAPDIQRLLSMHRDHMDMELIREYFKIFDKEYLLDEWLSNIK
ncbi:nucleotidyl transferase AbiEii/AbiGii toxin family protein [Thermodesulfobacteriota bacterium]